MIQCRCKFCQIWFRPSNLVIDKDGRKVCPICRLADGLILIEKED